MLQILLVTETFSTKTAPREAFCRKARHYMQDTLLTINAPMPKGYDDIMNPAYPALDLAARLTNSPTRLSRNIWRKRLAALGEERFREVLYQFWADIRAGEEVRTRARALTARLNKAKRAMA